MEIHVHPQLHTLASDFSQLDDASEPVAEQLAEVGPAVTDALVSSAYRTGLPEWYQPLLDAPLEAWTG